MKILPMLTIILLGAFIPALAQVDNTVIYSAEDTDSLFRAEFDFLKPPKLGQTAVLRIKMEAISKRMNEKAMLPDPLALNRPHLKNQRLKAETVHFDNALDLDVSLGPGYLAEVSDTTISWEAFIRPGDTLAHELELQLLGVGEFNLVLMENNNTKDRIHMHLAIVLDELGNPVYFGKYPPPYENSLGGHLYVFGDSISVYHQGLRQDIHAYQSTLTNAFDVKMTIEPTPIIGKPSEVRFVIEPMTDEIEALQYEITAGHNMKIESLPESPGDNPGPGKKIKSSFQITPMDTGPTYLGIEIFGLMPGLQISELAGSKIGYNLVFGPDSTLLYMGQADPFAVGFDMNNPAYEKIRPIAEYIDKQYGKKTYRSQPDFHYERKNTERIEDSIQVAREREADSLQNLQEQ